MKHIGNYIGETAYCIEHTPHLPEEADVEWQLDQKDLNPIFSDTEGDTPTHCSVCEKLIPHSLTSDGVIYVIDAIMDAIAGKGRKAVVKQWWDHYGPGISPDEMHDAVGFVIAAWPDADDLTPKL